MRLLLICGWLVIHVQVMAQPSRSGKLWRVVMPKLAVAVMSVALFSGATLAVHNKVRLNKPQLDFRYDRQHEPPLQGGELVQADNDEEVLQEWRDVRNNPPPHQRAVFYLLIDGFDAGW